jgi:hypothetical protein
MTEESGPKVPKRLRYTQAQVEKMGPLSAFQVAELIYAKELVGIDRIESLQDKLRKFEWKKNGRCPECNEIKTHGHDYWCQMKLALDKIKLTG